MSGPKFIISLILVLFEMKLVNAHFFTNSLMNFMNFNKISRNKCNFSRINVILIGKK